MRFLNEWKDGFVSQEDLKISRWGHRGRREYYSIGLFVASNPAFSASELENATENF
jgi:hypothetical protein